MNDFIKELTYMKYFFSIIALGLLIGCTSWSDIGCSFSDSSSIADLEASTRAQEYIATYCKGDISLRSVTTSPSIYGPYWTVCYQAEKSILSTRCTK